MYIIVLDTDDHELLPICWRTITIKFYFQAAGLYVAQGNLKNVAYISKNKWTKRKKQREKKFHDEAVIIKIIFREH